jgi:hypothetical protein
MFFRAFQFNHNISVWDTSSVENMDSMFKYAYQFNQNLCAWKDKFPYSNAANIFSYSGCKVQTTPVLEIKGPFCAVDDCPT